MPTIMSLQGADLGFHVITDPNVDCNSLHQPWQCSPNMNGAFGEGESGFMSWLRGLNPVLAGSVVVAMSVGTGLLLSVGTIKLFDALGAGPDSRLDGAPRRRRRRR